MAKARRVANLTTELTEATEPTVPTYLVTDKAPPFVAGRKVAEGDELQLTEAQKLYEELAGHIRDKAEPEEEPDPDEEPDPEDPPATEP